ncbi:Mpv17-like protein 2, partial [Lamellibrachia satsuma]
LLFSKYLLLTNTVITVCLSGTGDALQQYYEKVQKRQKHWDPVRTSHVCWTGAVIGPMCHFWYRYLEDILPGRTITPVLKKLFLDQVVFTPVYISVFLVMLGCLERATFSEMKRDLLHKGVVLLKADWMIWPPAQLVNFCLLPVQYRVLYDNTISLGFDCYYSHVKYRTD